MKVKLSERLRVLAGVLVALYCAGCGVMFLPGPTEKLVAEGDVVGQWQRYEDGTRTTVIITFGKDGTFTQTNVDSPGKVTTVTGGWRLEDAWVELTGYMPTGGGEVVDIGWYMVDGDETESGLTLFGGDASDPDCYVHMKKLN